MRRGWQGVVVYKQFWLTTEIFKLFLEEEIEALNQLVDFNPKFHCKLKFIKRFWCSAKVYTRANWGYSLEALRKTVPIALRSISTATIYRYSKHCMREGTQYGTNEFQ